VAHKLFVWVYTSTSGRDTCLRNKFSWTLSLQTCFRSFSLLFLHHYQFCAALQICWNWRKIRRPRMLTIRQKLSNDCWKQRRFLWAEVNNLNFMLYTRHNRDLLLFCLLSSICHWIVDNTYVYESKQAGFYKNDYCWKLSVARMISLLIRGTLFLLFLYEPEKQFESYLHW